MEVALEKSTNAGAGLVVRQFAPFRIERQVLAQVFELIWGSEAAADQVRSASMDTIATHRGIGSELQVGTIVARRRAA